MSYKVNSHKLFTMVCLQSDIDAYILHVTKNLDKKHICPLLYYYEHFSPYVYTQLYNKVKDIIDHKKLSMNKTLPLSLLQENTTLWDWEWLPRVREAKEVEDTISIFPWSLESFSYHCSFEFFQHHIADGLNWNLLSSNENIPLRYIFDTLHEHPWSLFHAGLREDITVQDALCIMKHNPNMSFYNHFPFLQMYTIKEHELESIIDMDLDYGWLSRNPNLSAEFISKHDDKSWFWNSIFKQPRPLWFIKKYTTNVNNMSACADMITVEDMVDNPHITWRTAEVDRNQCAKFLANYQSKKINAISQSEYLRCLFPNTSSLHNVLLSNTSMTYHLMLFLKIVIYRLRRSRDSLIKKT
jgi:hypothetical protein